MPAFAGPSLDVLARDGGVKLDHRFAAFDRCVRSPGNDYAGLNKTVPRIRARQTFDPQTRGRKMQIADRMRSLHRRNDSQLLEPRNVQWIHNLRMLDAPARIGNLALRRRNGFQSFLVLVENKAITPVADCMRFTLNAFSQSLFEYWQEIFFFDGQEAGCFGSVGIRFEQGRAARTKRAVRIKLQRAHGQAIAVSAEDWPFS